MSRGLHLRGQADVVHPTGRVRGLRSLRASLPGRGDLLRGRHPGGVEGVLQRQRGLLRRSGLSGWRGEDGRHRQGPPADRGLAASRTRRVTASAVRRRRSSDLPDFPWDTLAGAKARAQAHPDGIVDLSVGTPVDPTPEIGRRALAEAADSPGYPFTAGTAELRAAIVDYLGRRWAASGLAPEATLPVIGTKELVAWLPTLLGLGPGDLVVLPTVAYPTYAVGAVLAGCTAVAADDLTDLGDARPALVWLNSPANPSGAILDGETLARRVAAARERGALVAADECYGEFGWEAEPVSVLHPDISDGRLDGVLAVHSLSKRSNLAGYRAGFVSGDAEV